jgi:hypothetical protein
MSQESNLVFEVRQILEGFASKGKLVRFRDIEDQVGQKIHQHQWRTILDPIYEECVAQGKPDLTAIVVYGSGPT